MRSEVKVSPKQDQDNKQHFCHQTSPAWDWGKFPGSVWSTEFLLVLIGAYSYISHNSKCLSLTELISLCHVEDALLIKMAHSTLPSVIMGSDLERLSGEHGKWLEVTCSRKIGEL